MLVEWGCDQADRDGVEAYLVAALPAISLYKRFGFESVESETLPEGYIRTYMVRPRKEVGEEGDLRRGHKGWDSLLEAD